MIRNFVYRLLQGRRDRERHNVMKLRWKKAELERLLEQRKKEGKYAETR